MSSSEDICSVRSFSLYVRQIRWLDENVQNRSDLIRRLLDEHIEHSDGYAGVISALEKRAAELGDELRSIDHQIGVVTAKQDKFIQDRGEERESRIEQLRRELSAG